MYVVHLLVKNRCLVQCSEINNLRKMCALKKIQLVKNNRHNTILEFFYKIKLFE